MRASWVITDGRFLRCTRCGDSMHLVELTDASFALAEDVFRRRHGNCRVKDVVFPPSPAAKIQCQGTLFTDPAELDRRQAINEFIALFKNQLRTARSTTERRELRTAIKSYYAQLQPAQ
jgi:hypothetical protein